MPEQPSPLAPMSAPPGSAGWFRWAICGLLFFATTVNYIDRQVIALLKTDVLMGQLGWTERDYGHVIFFFNAAYAIGYAVGGRVMDRIGVRLGYGLAVFFWSLAAMSHAMARTVFSFSLARFGLGLSEGGNFPAAIKTVSEWFPKKERALATGIFNAGSNLGPLITPVLVPWIAGTWGWPAAFLVTGSFGFIWLICWFLLYQNPEEHPRLSPSEFAYIRSDPPDPPVKIPWLELLRHRQTWAFLIGMFLTSPIWWFYLYWIPGFLNKRHGLNLTQIGLPLVIIYLMTDVGSVGGGWLSSFLIKRGWSINGARKTALLACALCVVPVFSASMVSHLWVAVLLIGLAAAAHQGFSANLFTLVSDTVPRQVVSSVVGIGGMAGAIGGMIFAELAGAVLDQVKRGEAANYFILFSIAASNYLIALLLIHLLLPRLEPMSLERLTLSEPTAK